MVGPTRLSHHRCEGFESEVQGQNLSRFTETEALKTPQKQFRRDVTRQARFLVHFFFSLNRKKIEYMTIVWILKACLNFCDGTIDRLKEEVGGLTPALISTDFRLFSPPESSCFPTVYPDFKPLWLHRSRDALQASIRSSTFK